MEKVLKSLQIVHAIYKSNELGRKYSLILMILIQGLEHEYSQ